ncbi:MAG: methyltransferase domain-containing protein, partial [Bacteroidota bacterium]
VHNLAEPLTTQTDASFDGILSALALHYLADWEGPVKEFCRVLRPGGFVVLSIGHPFDDFLYYESEKYFECEAVSAEWKSFGPVVEVPTYRRSLQDSLRPFLANGFYLEDLLEPRPTPAFANVAPDYYAILNKFPAFLCLRMRKF